MLGTLLTRSSFAAASLGLPKMLKDSDIETEDPADVDDENVSEGGFQATLPGEYTKISSALALFSAARLLSKVLDEVYPAGASYELSLSRISRLANELDVWRDALPAHLRLEFVQDTLNVNVTSNRSPILVRVAVSRCVQQVLIVAGAGLFPYSFMHPSTRRGRPLGRQSFELSDRPRRFQQTHLPDYEASRPASNELHDADQSN